MLAKQVLTDPQGVPMGIFIPMQTWETMLLQYPEIEKFDSDIPQWEKDFIDMRVEMIQNKPERLRPIETLLNVL
jgi:hypothetical protein